MSIPTIVIVGGDEIVMAVRDSADRYQCDVVPMPRVGMWMSMAEAMTANDVTVIDSRLVSRNEIGSMMRIAEQTGQTVVLVDPDDPVVAGELRHLGTPIVARNKVTDTIQRIATERRWRERVSRMPIVIAIGTAKGGVGKTFTAINLAEAFTVLGVRVLLVDADISNASIAVLRRLPPTAVPYLRIVEQGDSLGFTEERLRACMNRVPVDEQTSLDILIPSDPREPTASDFTGRTVLGWEGFQRAVVRLAMSEGHDIVLVDVGPDIKRRPYPLHIVMTMPYRKGWCVIPALAGRLEVQATATMLSYLGRISLETPNGDPETGVDRALILPIGSERGFLYRHDQTLFPTIAAQWPRATILGVNRFRQPIIVPRAPDIVSYLESALDHYHPPVVEFPYHPFSQAIFNVVQSIAQIVGVTLPHSPPVPSWWERIKQQVRGTTNRHGVSLRDAVAHAGGQV